MAQQHSLLPTLCVQLPEVMAPAGLSSGQAHRAFDRGIPSTDLEYVEQDLHEDVRRRAASSAACAAHAPEAQLRALSAADIPGSRPSARPLLATSGVGGNWHSHTLRGGSRFVNPLAPVYVLPGHSEQPSPSGRATALRDPAWADRAAAASSSNCNSPAGNRAHWGSSPFRTSSPAREHKGVGSGGAASSTAQPHLPQSPSAVRAAAEAGPAGQVGGGSLVVTDGAVGGLLLYGPTFRALDVSDINGPRRSNSVPLRRNPRNPLDGWGQEVRARGRGLAGGGG